MFRGYSRLSPLLALGRFCKCEGTIGMEIGRPQLSVSSADYLVRVRGDRGGGVYDEGGYEASVESQLQMRLPNRDPH